jgi:hypothetical protein
MIRKCRETFKIALYYNANFYVVEKKTFKIPQITTIQYTKKPILS